MIAGTGDYDDDDQDQPWWYNDYIPAAVVVPFCASCFGEVWVVE